MLTRYGKIEIANSQPFSRHPNGFGISPYLQEKLVFLGQSLVYEQAQVMAHQLLSLSIDASQIYRLTTHYGAAIAPALQECPPPLAAATDLLYVQVDGAMLLTEDGYKENKLARFFAAQALQASSSPERGGQITHSQYVAHLGSAADFIPHLRTYLDGFCQPGQPVVFLSDGAPWLAQMMQQHCPQARLILDFFHALQQVAQVAKEAFAHEGRRAAWLETQRISLLESQLDEVLVAIAALPVAQDLKSRVGQYLQTNRYRMDYQAYRKEVLLIGSGAIEAAHRTVVQARLKRSGQRWSVAGAQHVLNLRVCQMSERWQLVRQQIEPNHIELAA